MELKSTRSRFSIGTMIIGLAGAIVGASASLPAVAQNIPVYRGAVQYPDFSGRDRAYANYRTRIVNEMRTGPNFAGRYAIVELGCGTGCSFVFVADVSTGRVYNFPYGGEEYYMMSLSYGVKSNYITAQWISDQNCVADDLMWNGTRFISQNRRVVGDSSRC